MNKSVLIGMGAAVALLAGCSSVERSRDLADPNVPGVTLAQQVCSNCHGMDGNTISPAFPQLAGQQPSYIVNQLTNFRAEQRTDPAGYRYMWGLSRHLTDAQIADIADYYSKQTPKRPRGPSPDATTLAAGKQLYTQGDAQTNVLACVTCHGPSAQGMAHFPRLAYQHSDYIVKQLDIFQNTEGRPGTPMAAVTHPLTAQQKASVAAYLQNFPE